jgi:hypothetical protein
LKEYTLKLNNNFKSSIGIYNNISFKEIYKIFKNTSGINILNYLFFINNSLYFLNRCSTFGFPTTPNINTISNSFFKILLDLVQLQTFRGKLLTLPKVYKISPFYKTCSYIDYNIKFSANKLLSNSTTTNLRSKYKNLSKFFIHNNNYTYNGFFYYNWVLNFIKNSISSKNNFFVKYTNTNVVKFINTYSLNSFDILFLRKSKVFNKGRYSRNRQFYRTGVYWCLYLSIILFTGLYYWFYHFIINFGFF